MNYKRGLAVVIGCVIAAAVSVAATWPRFHPAAPAGTAIADAPPKAAVPAPSLVADFPPLPTHDNPLSWARLTDAQHAALAPFASEWDHFSDQRRRKWLRIAARYSKLSPDAQKRLHERMTEWVRMTPEQRRVARENYLVSKDLPPQARKKAWTAYQQLSDEQKARLAATERRRRPTVVSAPPTGKRAMRDIDRLVNERARAPGAALQPAAQPASQPASQPALQPGALPGGVSVAASQTGAPANTPPNASSSAPPNAPAAAPASVAPAAGPHTVTPILEPDSPTYRGS